MSPYILEEERPQFDFLILTLLDKNNNVSVQSISQKIVTKGQLNYVLSSFLWKWFEKYRSYDTIDTIIREIEIAKFHIMGIYSISLEYLSSRITEVILHSQVPEIKKLGYALGTLECIKLEFYRRKAVEYETKKIEENKDI